MKNLFYAVGLTGLLMSSTSWSAKSVTSTSEKVMDTMSKASTSVDKEVSATYEDIKKTLGFVPTFLKNFPESGIAGAWEDMKGVQLSSNTAIPGKYKELIGLAVSSQIPCSYCTYFHTEAAKLNKANAREINESIAMSANVRRWSTFLNGIQMDEGQFRSEVDKILQFTNKQSGLQAMEEDVKPVAITTPEEAYKDMEMTMGMVPAFLRDYPKSGIVGIWKEMKGIEMNPESAVPEKYKQLIGLAVAAQVPCTYCTYYHTQAAYQAGATKEEVIEAVAMAGITRQWSTVLNGAHYDEKNFMRETDRIMNNLRSKMKKEVTLR